MADVIYRQEAIDAVEESRRSNHHRDGKEACAHEFEHRHFLNILRELPSAEQKIILCKDCKHFHYDMPYVIQGIPVLGHEVCDFWGDGCKTSENGFCSYAERKEDG